MPAGGLGAQGGRVEARPAPAAARPAAQGGVEELQARAREHRREAEPRAHPAHQVRARSDQLGAHAALLLPEAPGSEVAGRPCGAALGGERVEEGVGGGVVGLAGAAEQAGGRGEEDEVGEVELRGQLVQVPGGVDLGRAARAPAARGRATRARRRRARRREWTTAPSGCSAGSTGRAAPRAASRSATSQAATVTSAPSSSSSAAQLGGALGLGAAAADQEQVAGAVLLDQVAGDEGAEAAGAAGDQDGALGVERPAALAPRRPSAAGQARDEELALAQGELGLLGAEREGRRQAPARGLAAVAVDQGEAAGVLGWAERTRPQTRPRRGRRLALAGARARPR